MPDKHPIDELFREGLGSPDQLPTAAPGDWSQMSNSLQQSGLAGKTVLAKVASVKLFVTAATVGGASVLSYVVITNTGEEPQANTIAVTGQTDQVQSFKINSEVAIDDNTLPNNRNTVTYSDVSRGHDSAETSVGHGPLHSQADLAVASPSDVVTQPLSTTEVAMAGNPESDRANDISRYDDPASRPPSANDLPSSHSAGSGSSFSDPGSSVSDPGSSVSNPGSVADLGAPELQPDAPAPVSNGMEDFGAPQPVSASSLVEMLDQMPALVLTEETPIERSESFVLPPDTSTVYGPRVLPDKKWAVMPYFSLDRSDYILDELDFLNSSAGTYDIQINQPQKLRFTAGVRAEYEFYPGIRLQTGFLYSRKGTMTGTVSLLYPNGLSGDATYNFSGEYFEVPLMLKLTAKRPDFNWYVMGGGHLQMNVASADNYFEFKDWSEGQQYHVGLAGSSVGFVLRVAAGAEFRVNDRFGVFVEPAFSYNLHPVIKLDNFNKIPVNPKINTFALGTGIKYNF